MTKSDIRSNLKKKHRALVDLINSLSEEEFVFSNNGKWTAGQQLQHIYLSIKPLEKILRSVDILIQAKFGKSQGNSRNYDEIVKEYLSLLEDGARSNSNFAPTKGTPFEPTAVLVKDRAELTEKVTDTIDKLCINIGNFSDPQLDDFYIPHPLLKDLTIREMMCFTIYHVQHHHNQIRPNLKIPLC